MKLLLVSYHYPPMGGAGVQRALKFSKYLGDFGVQCTVLAAQDPSYQQDASLLAEIPGEVPVLRIEHRPLLQRALAWRSGAGRGAAAAAAPAQAAASTQLARTPAPTGAGRATAGASRHRLRDAALAAYASVHFPDDKAGWARRARAPALARLREERFDLVFSTAPPMSAHALAATLARRAGLPWVADYRDLWTENPAYAAPAWRRALDRRTEAAWLAQAAGVVTVTPSWQRLLAARLGSGRPVAFIPNGYDEADFAALSPAPRADGVFRLVHTGAFYGPRDPGTLLEALALYLVSASPAARPLRLRLVGMMGSRFAEKLRAFEARHPGVVEQRPYVPHHEALAEMLAADALLLVVGAGGGQRARATVAGTLPGKIFEYLRAARPLLLLGDEAGDAAALLRQHGRGWVADETQPAAIAAALRQMMQNVAEASTAPAPSVARFERRALAGELAQFLRRCREGVPP
ncbi:MAG: glycosyltransferase [Rubrivivax sp.]|nr:glycosyltransferase [Rubrivivax sp.]